MSTRESPQDRMMTRDRFSAHLGLVVTLAEPGRAVVQMTIRDDMLNGFDIAHGGVVFSLADTAFALACNEDERVTVAAGADVSFLRPSVEGQLLTATAARRSMNGRSGIYDVTVSDEQGRVVAEFRGRSRTTTFDAPSASKGEGNSESQMED